jgi:hypothetical protein
MPLSSKSFRVSSQNRKIQDVPDVTPTISAVSDGGAAGTTAFDELRVSVSANVVTGGIPDAYRVVSTPGNIVSVGGSPVSVRGLTPGTNYTFTATPQTSAGTLGTPSTASVANTPTGAVVPIATSTLSANGFFFFNNIPQTYTDLYIVYSARAAQTSDNYLGAAVSYINMYFNSITSVTMGSVQMYTNGGGSAASARITNNVAAFSGLIPNGNATSGIFGTGVIHILSYADTTKNKTVLTRTAADLSGSGITSFDVSSWISKSAINAITLYTSYTNFIAGSTATLYGIKAA